MLLEFLRFNNMDEELYKEFILDLARHPLNKKKLADFDIEQKGSNISCGDEIQVYIKLDKNSSTSLRADKKVKDIGFLGQGCVISQAAASLLTEEIKGKNMKEIMSLTEKDVTKLLNVEVIYTRKKCALLCLNALQAAIKKYASTGN